MKHSDRVRNERRNLVLRACERWKGFQPVLPTVRGAETDRAARYSADRQATTRSSGRASRARAPSDRFDSPAYRGPDRGRATDRRHTRFRDLPPSEQALKADARGAHRHASRRSGAVPQGFATGFLVAPICSPTITSSARATRRTAWVHGSSTNGREPVFARSFRARPSRFFVNDRELDYALSACGRTR
jgi:hypothetical protein